MCVALVWHVCSTDIDECLEFDSGSGSGGDSDASLSGSGSDGIGLSGSGSGDSQEVCPPDQFCVNTFGSFLCLCLPGFTSVGGACLGKSMRYATRGGSRILCKGGPEFCACALARAQNSGCY